MKAGPTMATLDTKSATGTKAGSVELDDAMFGIEPNVPVMHQVVTAQLAARRSGTQSTKTRAEVRGGGAKPWKQKGTGRARAGSSRSPLWVGGGVVARPQAPLLRPADPQEDDPPRPQVGPVGPAGRRAHPGHRLGPRGAEHQGRHRHPRGQRRRRAACSPCSAPRTPPCGRASATCDNVHICGAGELNAYDVLVSDWLIFTPDTLPVDKPVSRGAPPPSRRRPPTEEVAS